jgi:signal transduction histidine kinase
MQIRTKLTLQFAMIVAAILSASVAIINYSSVAYREKEFHDRLRAKAATTADLFIRVNEVDSALLRLIDSSKRDVLPNENITIYNAENKVVYTNNDTIDFPISSAELEWIRREGEVETTYGEYEIIQWAYPKTNGGFVVTAGAIDKYGKSKLRNLQQILIIVLVTGLLAVGISGWVYAGRALRPISIIVDNIDHISANNLHARLKIGKGRDEMVRLSETFNKMLTRLEKAFKLQKTFVANVSHELKNPLSTVTSQLEVILLRDREGAEYRKTIASVLEDIKKLNKTAFSLLDLARLNADEVKIELSPLRMDELLWTCRKRLLEMHPDYRINLHLDLPEDDQLLLVGGNEDLLHIAFSNLMENGCKFSNDHRIDVKFHVEAHHLVLQFQDEGVGIQERELSDIFQPFFRGQNSTVAYGHGIGLSLVERILQLHGATIAVESIPNKGSVFTVTFNRNRMASL